MQNPFKVPIQDVPKNDDDKEEEKKVRPVIKSALDLQRLKLEKLMKNPNKPIIIPESPREKDYMQTVPSFVRNVMGSSAGAGSGEFHVYRHLRRKEYARQKSIQYKSMKEKLDEEYQMKLEKNRLEAEAKTAKKRAKRLKKKQRPKKSKVAKNDEDEKQNTSDDDDEDDDDEEKQETSSSEQKEQEETTKSTKDAEVKDMQTCENPADQAPDNEEKTNTPSGGEISSNSNNKESNDKHEKEENADTIDTSAENVSDAKVPDNFDVEQQVAEAHTIKPVIEEK